MSKTLLFKCREEFYVWIDYEFFSDGTYTVSFPGSSLKVLEWRVENGRVSLTLEHRKSWCDANDIIQRAYLEYHLPILMMAE